jgi:hypothetical protein
MTESKPQQKIISFAENNSDIDKITQSIMDGWTIVKLIPYDNYYIGVMEKMLHGYSINNSEETIYIPPRKKVTFN